MCISSRPSPEDLPAERACLFSLPESALFSARRIQRRQNGARPRAERRCLPARGLYSARVVPQDGMKEKKNFFRIP